jgi:eukaryotic-like serine/threonine-protein kinase
MPAPHPAVLSGAMNLAPGTHLGPYQIIAPLGSGGMGEVYRARDPRLDRNVAIKVLPARLAADVVALHRFERETKALAALAHPNILSIFDVGSERGVTYAVTELLEGQTLRERLSAAPVPWREAARICAAIADGLAAAHARGIVHRDLKPENIFLAEDGRVIVLDFGIAGREPVLDSSLDEAHSTVTLTTQPGTVMGTLGYMSPEQLRGETVGPPSDIFAVGCVLYEMVTARPAFRRNTAAETIAAVLQDEPEPILGVEATRSAPDRLQEILRHCLEKSAARRIASARSLAEALRALESEPDARMIAPMPRASTLPARWRRPAILAAAAAAVAALAWIAIDRARDRDQQIEDARAPIESLAVLPLVNLSSGPEEDYFADGMTEAIIADLAKIGALRVISRTSVMQYKGARKPVAQIARELDVAGVIEGTVLREGDRVRITANLIDAFAERHLWSESYERELRSVLALQREIAQAIAQEIRVALTEPERSRLASGRDAVDPGAYVLYLQGRHHWNKRSESEIQAAIALFDSALARDPSFALAHVGLADAYLMLGDWSVIPITDAKRQVETHARAALAIDPTLGEAHATLAQAHSLMWEWEPARAEFEDAIALSPAYATAYQWYAEYLSAVGRSEESITMLERAASLDPLSLIIHAVAGIVYSSAREPDPGIEHCRKAIAMDSTFVPAHLYLGFGYASAERFPECIATLEHARTLWPDSPAILAGLGYAYGRMGRTTDAGRMIAALDELGRHRYVTSFYEALIRAGLDERREALRLMSKAVDERAAAMKYAKTSPWFDALRDEPEFNDILRRMDLD